MSTVSRKPNTLVVTPAGPGVAWAVARTTSMMKTVPRTAAMAFGVLTSSSSPGFMRSLATATAILPESRLIVDLGKIAVAVAKDRMNPGELLEVKTPNAIAAVRGTVFIIEVVRATAQATPGPAGVTTNVFGFSDTVDLNYFLSGRTLAV